MLITLPQWAVRLKQPPAAIEQPPVGVAVAVLGELVVLVDGQAPPLRRKDRAVIAYLAIMGRPQHRNTLIDLFFQEAEDPAAALRLVLSRIRRHLGPTLLRSGEGQIALDPEGYWLDLRIFEALLGGDPVAAPQADLSAAVALVRGALLDRLSIPGAPEFDLWLLSERAHVQRRLTLALQRLSEYAAAARQFDAAIGYARALVNASPLLEEAHARLIRLYLQIGQQSAALAQFEQCCDLLGRELAVAPSCEFLALRETISASDAGWPAAHASPTPALLPVTPSTGFYERERELAWLQALWERACQGNGAVVLLIGEAGSGKSRLLREFVRSFSAKQLQLGACSELGRQIPYEPWAELLTGRLSPADLQALPKLWRNYLLNLLPGLAAQAGAEALPVPLSAAGGLDQLCAVVAEVLMPAGGPPQLVVLEDLHWADPASLQLFGYLARRAARRTVLLVGSLRTHDTPDEPALKALLDGLERIGAISVPLAPLSEAAVSSMAARFLNGVNAAQVPAVGSLVRRATGGNALFVTEVLRELSTYARLPTELPIPGSVRELIGQRLARLTGGERQVLEALAVLNAPTSLNEAADVSARTVDEVASALDQGQRWGLLVSDPGDDLASYRFSHELSREAVVAQLSLAHCQALHRRIVELLACRAASQPHTAHLAVAERLLHHAQAADAPDLVLRWALIAVERATSLYAYGEALRKIDLGLAAYARLQAAGEETLYRLSYLELLLRRILVLNEIGHGYAAMVQLLDDAAAALTPDTPDLLRALYRYCRMVVLIAKPDYALAVSEHLQVYNCFVQLGELRLAADCLMQASNSLRTISCNQEAYATTLRALAIYRDLNERDGELACRHALGLTLINLGRYQEASSVFQEMLALAVAQQSALGQARAHYLLGFVWHTMYQGQRTIDHIRQAIDRFNQLEIPGMVARCLLFLGAGLEVIASGPTGLQGGFAQAGVAYAESWRQANRFHDHWLRGWAAQLIGRRAFWDGDLPAARLWLGRATSIRQEAGERANQRSDLAWAARLALAEGHPADALALSTQALAGLAEARQEFYVFETPDLYLIHAQALAANGDRRAAEQMLARAEEELAQVADQIHDKDIRRHYRMTSALAQRIRAGIS
ncbi:MAG: hypothetical protein OHK0015_46900 [Chloroflexi bacterium OHK40]